jgi:hypothetical protein
MDTMRRPSYSYHSLLATLILFGTLAECVEADTVDRLVLLSQNGGQYDYGIQLAPNHGLVFTADDQIVLSGLAGVTGASVLPSLNLCFSAVTTTAASVTTISSRPCPVFDPTPTGVIIEALRVFSSVLTTAPVSYEIETGNEGTLSGTVAGPAIVPEPAVGLLTISGLIVFLARGLKASVRPRERK